MKALTICQPWAWAIAEGIKTVENRTWPTSYRGPLLIHAGQSRVWMPDACAALRECHHIEVPSGLAFGVILGVCELVDCVRYPAASQALRDDPFADGPWCWLLEKFRPLKKPLPWRGAQGLFQVELPATASFV